MWWLSGIFREVSLLWRPPAYLADVVVDAPYDPALATGAVVVRGIIGGNGGDREELVVEADVFDGGENLAAAGSRSMVTRQPSA